jgi:hypothetical protein
MRTLTKIAGLALLLAGLALPGWGVTFTKLGVSGMTTTTVTITFTTSGSVATQINWGVGNVATATAQDAAGTTHTFTLTGLSTSAVYSYQAEAVDGTTSATQQFALCGSGQQTVPMSGTVNAYYSYGTYSMTFTDTNSVGGTPTFCGTTLSTYSGTVLGGGALSSQAIPDNLKTVPSPSTWAVTVQDVGSIGPFTAQASVTAATPDISTVLEAGASGQLQWVWYNPATQAFFPTITGGSGSWTTLPGGVNATGNTYTVGTGTKFNIASTGLFDLSAGGVNAFRLPTAAGCSPSNASALCMDSTTKRPTWYNGSSVLTGVATADLSTFPGLGFVGQADTATPPTLFAVAPVGTKCYPFQGSGGRGCDTPSGSISGLTTNRVSKATSATTIGDSSITDDGTTVSVTENVNHKTNAILLEQTGDATTVANKLAKVPAGATAVITATGDSFNSPAMICVGSCGTPGTQQFAAVGAEATCVMDVTNASGVAGQPVFKSVTGLTTAAGGTAVAGDCSTDSAANVPAGTFILGKLLVDATTAGSAAKLIVRPGWIGTAGSFRTVTSSPDTILDTDQMSGVVYNSGSAVAVTLPQAGTAGFKKGTKFFLQNVGAGLVTITPTTSTISCLTSGASTQTLTTGQGITIISDGTNYACSGTVAAGTGVTNVGVTAPGAMAVTGSPVTSSGTIGLSYPAFTSNPGGDLFAPYVGALPKRITCGSYPTGSGGANFTSGCSLTAQGTNFTGVFTASSSTPVLGSSTAPTTGTFVGYVDTGAIQSASKWEFVSGRPTGLLAYSIYQNSATTNLRYAIGFSGAAATTSTNYFTCGTTPGNPLCWDTTFPTQAAVFLGYSSTSGSYGGALNGEWVLVSSDGSGSTGAAYTFTDTGVAFTAATTYYPLLWEDTTGASCSVANSVACWCAAVGTLTGSNQTLSWTWSTTKCVNGTANKVPAVGTQLSFVEGSEGNGGTTGTVKLGSIFVQGQP